MIKESSRTISFRLSGDPLKELDAQAQRADASPGDVARDYALAALKEGSTPTNDGDAQMLMESLRDEVLTLRRDLATVMEMLLLNVAKIPEDDVREFVTKNLRG